jgi:hypothetical protein
MRLSPSDPLVREMVELATEAAAEAAASAATDVIMSMTPRADGRMGTTPRRSGYFNGQNQRVVQDEYSDDYGVEARRRDSRDGRYSRDERNDRR